MGYRPTENLPPYHLCRARGPLHRGGVGRSVVSKALASSVAGIRVLKALASSVAGIRVLKALGSSAAVVSVAKSDGSADVAKSDFGLVGRSSPISR